MFSNRLAVVLLGVGCITAAGLGGYFAARQNTVPTPAAAQAQPIEGVPLVPATAERPVQETEALVGDTARPKAAPVAAEREPAPVTSRNARRSEPPPSRSASTPARERTTSARNDPRRCRVRGRRARPLSRRVPRRRRSATPRRFRATTSGPRRNQRAHPNRHSVCSKSSSSPPIGGRAADGEPAVERHRAR